MTDETLYVYSDHQYGEYYVSDDEYEIEICPQCGDSDTLEYMGTYDEILYYLEEDIKRAQQNYDTVKEAISFYLRNGMCKKIRSLYKRALEDARINNFHKDFLIMAYLDYLMLPTTSNAELLSEYLLYRDQMQDDSLKDSITQRIQKRTGIGA